MRSRIGHRLGRLAAAAALSALVAWTAGAAARAADGEPAAGATQAAPPAEGGAATPAPAPVEPALLCAKVANMLVVTNPVKSEALSLGGVSSLEVPSGSLFVLSRSPRAVLGQGVSKIKAHAAGVAGGSVFQNLAKATADQNVPVPWATDPLAGILLPDLRQVKQQQSVQAGPKEELTLDPGAYEYIAASGDARIRLNPGTFVITKGFSLKDHATVTGDRVLLINLGRFQSEGFGGPTLSAPLEGPYRGLAILQPRSNSQPFVITSGANITGTVYIPSATFGMDGIGKATIGSLVADSVIVKGSNTLTIEGASFIPADR